MAVKLLLSPPAGGKTSFCIEEIQKIRSNDPFASVKVIVPDRMQMAWWKKTLARNSGSSGKGYGFIGTEVISFSKLAMEILETIPGSPALIPPRLDSLCIRKAVSDESKKQAFAYFDPIREKPGLLSLFEQTIHSLQRGCITPEDLENASGEEPKAADTARVYRRYLEILRENNWICAAGLLNAAANLLQQDPSVFPRCRLLAADGFNELSGDCLKLLQQLSPVCDTIIITLPADPLSDAPKDLRILKNADLICSTLDAERIAPEKHEPDSDFLRLADNVFYPARSTENSGKNITTLSDKNFVMIEASTRTTELREALREVKKRIVIENIRPADCAVFVPDMTASAPILRQFGREMRIPLRFSRSQPLAESPAASALKRLLHLAPDFETLKVLSVLRLPFFSGCPDPEDTQDGNYSADLAVAERVGRNMNVISGIGEWDAAFTETLKSAPEKIQEQSDDAADPEEGKVYEYPPREKLERIHQSFLKFANLLTAPEGSFSRTEWVKWLENILTTLHFYEHIEDPVGRSFETDFKALLKRIIFCENKLGQGTIPYADFLSELETEINAAEQTEQEFAGDRVFVGDISQTSGCRWKLVVLTGFAEGTFPRPQHEELILTDALREKLGLPLPVDQQLLFHHALTRAETALIITRPQKTDKGEEWPPSIYWQNIRENLEKGANLRSVSDNTPVDAASVEELAFISARNHIDLPENLPQPLSEELQKLQKAAAEELPLMKEQFRGKYSPDQDPELKASLADPVMDAVPYSCSAIETWLSCPFRYFLQKKLKLEQPLEPGTGMDAAQKGTLNHRVMELTFPPGTVYSSKEEALERAEQNITKVLATAPREFGFRESELWEYEKADIRQKLLDTIEKMFDAKKSDMPVNSQWMSVGAETKFGYPKDNRENTAPLTVETTAGPIQIRGIIDRIDKRDDGLLRVVDYKTGLSGFSQKELDAGSHIQAGIYAAAVVHALHMGPKCQGMYWSINKKTVKAFMEYDSENAENIPNIGFLNRFAEGIRDALFPAENAGDSCPDYCPAAAWCRKYVRRQNYG